MTRSLLPQNYVTGDGDLFDDCETVGDWSKAGNGTLAADTTVYKTGTQGLKLTVTTPGGSVNITKTVSMDMDGPNRAIGLWIYNHGEKYDIESITIIASMEADFSKYYITGLDNVYLVAGWNYVVIPRSKWSTSNGASWDNPVVRVRITLWAATGKSPAITIDDIRTSVVGMPRLIITFDDCFESVYTIAEPIMTPLGIKATCYVTTENTENTGSLSLAQCKELYAAGWAIGGHGTDHTDYAGMSEEDIETDIAEVVAWLQAEGFNRSALHMSTPYGSYSADIHAAITANGIETNRITSSGIFGGRRDRTYIPCYPVSKDDTVATITAEIDKAILSGCNLCLLWHNISASPSTGMDYDTTKFTEIMQYIAQSKIKCVTIDEWYNGFTNPRYRSVPLTRTSV